MTWLECVAICVSIGTIAAGCGPRQIELPPATQDLLAICTAGLTLERERAYRAEWAASGGAAGLEESTRAEGGRTFNLRGLEGEDAIEGYRVFIECARDVLAGQYNRARAVSPQTEGVDHGEIVPNVLGRLNDGTEIVQDPAPARRGDVGIIVIKGMKDGQLTNRRLDWAVRECGRRVLGSSSGPYVRFQTAAVDQCTIEVYDRRTGERTGSWRLWVEL